MDRLVVTMPALYRPEILAATFWSFDRGLFRQFAHRTLILNVDPLGVSPDLIAQRQQTILMMAGRYFDEIIPRFAQQASFAHAVHWLWEQAVARQQHFLHLEDDWVLNRSVPAAAMMALLEQQGLGSIRLQRQRNLKLAQTPSLSLNPVFMNYRFVSQALPMFQLDKDPEKQFQLEPLQSHLSHWRHSVVPAADGLSADRGGWVSDIGVHWRKGQGLEKVAEGGRSHWRAAGVGFSSDLSYLKSNLQMRFKLWFYRARLWLNLLWPRD